MARRGSYAKGSARREEILSMTLRVIAEKGFAAATLRAVGRELGIEPAHILYYFASREELLTEVIRRWDVDSLGEAPVGSDALAVFALAARRNLGVRGVLQMYLAFATEASDEGHPAHAFIQARFTTMVRQLAETFEVGKHAGIIRADIDSVDAARELIAISDGLQLQALVDPSVDAPRALDAWIDSLFVDEIRVPIDLPASFGLQNSALPDS